MSNANQPHPGEPCDRAKRATLGDDRAFPALVSGAFPPELLAIWTDPAVRRLASRRAGDPDLAPDAPLRAVRAVARVGDLRRINEIQRARFCRVLINEVYHLRGQLVAARVCEPATLAKMDDARMSGSPWDETAVVTRLIARSWLESFRAQRDHLRASVPGRSGQPNRYRDLIVAVAENVLRAVDGQSPGAKPKTRRLLREDGRIQLLTGKTIQRKEFTYAVGAPFAGRLGGYLDGGGSPGWRGSSTRTAIRAKRPAAGVWDPCGQGTG